ncbi:cobalt transporter CbiM [Geitlerinema sp. PCC 9228]|jgi:cobalt/nickel transport system permease protein|uniref:cobalt transporter CbiM n=1 Tax=Geitlerinema sp. PCC 9228 TaxID=111611 RepID=UPI0008F986EE|nr:cobalt transporter CbiM [Geitlerinema sp. PCC 9228]
MHVPDGLLPAKIYLGGYAIASLSTWYSLRQIHRYSHPEENVPKASLLTAAFFLATLIHLPIPPASVHLVLNGMLGAVLGYYAFPAILIGLFFQAVMFGHGGLTTLGVNASMMGLPALLAGYIFHQRHVFQKSFGEKVATPVFAFLAGAIGLGLSAAVFFSLVITNIPADLDANAEKAAIYGLMVAHIPLMAIEGVFTAMLVAFLQRVKPELLETI